MTKPPTPAEITEALAVLRAVPGVRDIDSLGVIERKNAPIWCMTRELNELTRAPDLTPVVLAEIAARHGLRITTDPGELVGYTAVVPINSDGGWMLDHGVGTYGSDDLDSIRSLVSRSGHQCVVALRLLPEGGKA